MIRPFRGTDGSQFQHNFKNTFLDEAELRKPTKEMGKQVAEHTRRVLDELVHQKTSQPYGRTVTQMGTNEAHYVRYTPKALEEEEGFQSKSRIVKIQEVQKDPLQVSKFRTKRIPKGPGSPPPILMRSPPRKLTVTDQLDWKIPPCISNWKNAKGYTIPLEMRLSADGRTLQHHTVNSKFAQLTDGLYIAERQSRKELEERNRIMKSIAYREQQEKEEELRRKAADARAQKTSLLQESVAMNDRLLSENEKSEAKLRDEMRYIRKRELERDQRIDAAGYKKAKAVRDKERDISEKIALGQAQPTTSELIYDQRLFNQTAGVHHGFGDDDEYDAFDKPLFQDRSNVSLYSGIKKTQGEAEGRTKPVEFEKSNDIFGMDSFIQDDVQKKVKKD